ncbi:MAG: permease prefix domain 1-containing protein [Actinomycetota bacterium]
MSENDQISTYLDAVGSALQLPRPQRRRAVEEIRNHLDDGATAHMRDGLPRAQAVALAITELGEPEFVAAGFNDEGEHGSEFTGVRRWLPVLVPVCLFTVRASFLAWSAVWILDGWTVGERTAQLHYLLGVALMGLLSYGAYVSVKRSQRDATWRWAAWACAGLALGAVALRAF